MSNPEPPTSLADPSLPPTGANLSLAAGPLRLSDEAIAGASDKVRGMLLDIPQWFWYAGAAFWFGVSYAAWRVLKATAPVLVPAALGLPPGSAAALEAAMQPSGAPPATGGGGDGGSKLQLLAATMAARGQRSGTADLLAQLTAASTPVPSTTVPRTAPPTSVPRTVPGAPDLAALVAPLAEVMASRGQRSRSAEALAELAATSSTTRSQQVPGGPILSVVSWLQEQPGSYTVAEIAAALGLDERAARRALEAAVAAGRLHAFKNGAERTKEAA